METPQKTNTHGMKPQEKELAHAISFFLDMERDFKLYSFRIIEPQVFIAQMETYSKQFISNIENIRAHANQTDETK